MRVSELLEAAHTSSGTLRRSPPDSIPKKVKGGHKDYSPHAKGPDSKGQEITKRQVAAVFKEYKQLAIQITKETGFEAFTDRGRSDFHRGQHYYAGNASMFIRVGQGFSKKEATSLAYRLANQYDIPFDWDWESEKWEPSINVWSDESGWSVGYHMRERGARVFGY